MAIKLINSHTPYIESNDVTPLRINGRMTGCKGLSIIGVGQGQCMCLVSGVSCQEFGLVVDGQVIHTTLHWAKKVMVKMWDVDGLVDNQGE